VKGVAVVIIDTKTYAVGGEQYSWLEIGQRKQTFIRYANQGGREDPSNYIWQEQLVDTYTDLQIITSIDFGGRYDSVTTWHIDVLHNFPKAIAKCEYSIRYGLRINVLFKH